MYSKAIRLRRLTTVFVGFNNKCGSCKTFASASSKIKDPFGLRDELNLEESIQGIYMGPGPLAESGKGNNNDPAEQEGSVGGLNSEEIYQKGKEGALNQVETSKYLKEKYGNWAKSRKDNILAQDYTSQCVYEASFGQIRYDMSNPVKFDGQFDDRFIFEPPKVEDVATKHLLNLGGRDGAPDTPEQTDPPVNLKGKGRVEEVKGQEIQHQERQRSKTQAASGHREISGNTSAGIGHVRSNKESESENVSSSTKRKYGKEDNVKARPMAETKPVEQRSPAESHEKPSVNESNTSKRKQSIEDLTDQLFPGSKPKEPKKQEAKASSPEEDTEPKTALEFIKLMRLKDRQKAEQNVELKVGGRSVNMPPAKVNIEAKEHVPKIYNPVDWNEITHDDVWLHLKHNICFENEFLVALNKPLGLAMHSPTTDNRHVVIDFLDEFAAHSNVPKMYPCHRLDKDTTGVLLLAKTEQAAIVIRSKFADRTMLKQYFAIVKNCPEVLEGTIKIPIGEGKIHNSTQFRAVLKPDLEKYNIKVMQKNCAQAVTWFKVLTSQTHCAFVEVRPETGLTHQIRVHLAHALGCPILGDHKYSHRDKLAPQRLHEELLHRLKVKQSKVRHLPLHLHCSKLQFTMPDGFMSKNFHEPIFVHARPPSFFMRSLSVLGLKK